jgi:predicted amidohydrolase YtcJ
MSDATTPPGSSLLLADALIVGGSGEPVDILIVDGVISAIGGPGTLAHDGRTVDLDGRWVAPGLWDNHVHFTQHALERERLDVSAAGSARQAASMVAASIHESPNALPYIGVGFRDGLWPDAPTFAVLDDAVPDRPVVVVSGDLHTVWLNSPALALYGYSDHPTGVLLEDLAFEIVRRINDAPADRLDAWADGAAREAASRGVVGIVDLEMTWNLDTWRRRMEGGTDVLRVDFGIYPQHLDRAIELGLRTGDAVTDLLTVGPLKVITDGSLNTRTAYTYAEYPGLEGQPLSHGMLTTPGDEIVSLLRRGAAVGIEPTVHAIGDHANAVALDAFEAVGCRGRIEHAQLVAGSDFARFARLGVVASVQPEHAMDDRDVADHYWAEGADRSFALRSLLDAGAELALGSDAPVAPLDPWISMSAAISRSRDGRDGWHPEQSITPAEALAASVRTSVEVGQRADLVVTPTDPLATDPDALRTMPVHATLLGGRFTFDAL